MIERILFVALERNISVQYSIVPDENETNRSHISISDVFCPVFKNGKETEQVLNITSILSPAELDDLAERIGEKEGLCL